MCSGLSAKTDLTINHVELNQVVQDWGNRVPLIVGKALGVRVSVEANGPPSPFGNGDWFVDGAVMDVYHGSTRLGTLSPKNGTVEVKPFFVDPQTYRADATRTFNFLVPSLWQFSDGITLVITINSLLHVPETDTTNDSITVPVTLHRTVIPQVVGLTFSSPSHTYSRSNRISSFLAQLPAAAHLWPVTSMYFIDCCGEQQYWDTERPDINPEPNPTDIYFPGADQVVEQGDQARQTTLNGQFKNALWYVLQPWFTGLNGWTKGSGKTFPSYALTASTGQDTTGGYEGEVMAHELAHQLSQLHTGGDVTQALDPSCCPGGRINDLHPTTFGLDTSSMTVLPPTASDGSVFAHDFMAYFNVNQWVSDYTYERLYRLLTSPITAVHTAAATARAAAAARQLFVTGRIAADAATVDPGFVLSAPADASANAGPYELQLRDAGGNVLTSRRFDTHVTDPGPLGGGAGEGPGPLGFSARLPYKPAATSLVLLHDGVVIATRARSGHAPKVAITLPRRGVHWSGARKVTWTASDADRDALRYLVQYSADGGRTWLTVATGLSGTSFAIDARALKGSRNCRVRVFASDGLNTSVAESSRFGVNPHAPHVRIISARAVNGGRQLQLEASAYDPDQGPLDGASVVWRSGKAGRLGTGTSLGTARLAPGVHEITVVATDKTGHTGRAHTRVRLDGPKEPGAPRSVSVRRAGKTDRLSWLKARGPVTRYIVQRAAPARVLRFRTLASLPPGARSARIKAGGRGLRYRVGACKVDGCAFASARA